MCVILESNFSTIKEILLRMHEISLNKLSYEMNLPLLYIIGIETMR